MTAFIPQCDPDPSSRRTAIDQARLEAFGWTGVAPLADRSVEVDADDSNAVPHHAVIL